jgi:23S rRNA (uracil1939-C5)-methyltransferase
MRYAAPESVLYALALCLPVVLVVGNLPPSTAALRLKKMLLTIEKLVYGGDGLARTPSPDGRSRAVFVPFVLPGERLEAEITAEKPGFARALVTQMIEPSLERSAAPCPYFAKCGGCHYQHIPYEQQLNYKAQILAETIARIAKIELQSEIQSHPSPPWNYRNRTRLQICSSPEFTLTYHRFASHDLLPIRECPVSSPLINRVMAKLLQLQGCNCPDFVEEIELFTDAADEHLLAWCFCGRDADRGGLLSWAEKVRAEVQEIAGITFFTSRRRDDDSSTDPVRLAQSGAEHIDYPVLGDAYRVSAGAFFQVNRHLLGELVATVTADVGGEVAFDLYAGVGLFSVALAPRFHHIFSVEASQTSYADLRHNAPANVKAVHARAEDYLSRAPAQKRPELVVLDPPRSGVGKRMVGSLVKLGASRMRYVSCDPATLARDLAPFLAAGYRIEQVHLFDLFPETFHIESVLLLSR